MKIVVRMMGCGLAYVAGMMVFSGLPAVLKLHRRCRRVRRARSSCLLWLRAPGWWRDFCRWPGDWREGRRGAPGW
jgi:hypothetical protein